MTISAAPMASGANGPAPFSMTVQPIVRTRKKVPMNSTKYLFIEGLQRMSDKEFKHHLRQNDGSRQRTLTSEACTRSALVRHGFNPVLHGRLARICLAPSAGLTMPFRPWKLSFRTVQPPLYLPHYAASFTPYSSATCA